MCCRVESLLSPHYLLIHKYPSLKQKSVNAFSSSVFDHERPVEGAGGPAEAGPLTWLGVAVVHRVAVQLQELLRLGLLLPVAAHGERVLAHLRGGGGEIDNALALSSTLLN